jgi:hypothetical protein
MYVGEFAIALRRRGVTVSGDCDKARFSNLFAGIDVINSRLVFPLVFCYT